MAAVSQLGAFGSQSKNAKQTQFIPNSYGFLAAKDKIDPVFLLAALDQLTENPHPAHQLSTAVLYPGASFAISNTASRLFHPLYDNCVRSRSTSKERDAETGLDYFLARYYSGAQGRFTSPDEFTGGIVDPFTGGQVGQPGPLPYADITDPQTINKYAYVRNNPLRYTDPDGHVIDVLADAAFILYDTYKIVSEGATKTNVAALAADVGAALLPGVTGTGLAVRAGAKAEHAIEAGVHIATEAGIKANRAKGVAAEAKAAGELVQEGRTILGSQVGVQTKQGLRRPDHLTQTAAGEIVGVEVKAGKGTRNPKQRAKDAEIAKEGGKIVGKNAPENLRGRKVRFPTEERRYPD